MAAVTVAKDHRNVKGRQRSISARLTAPANGDTWITGLNDIDGVQLTFATAAAAADSVSAVVGTGVNAGKITFTVIGTARDLWVEVLGR